MAIKGTTDSNRLPSLGNVNTGDVKGEKRAGKNLGELLRVTLDPVAVIKYKRESGKDLNQVFQSLYGTDFKTVQGQKVHYVRQLSDVIFYHAEVDQALNAWMRDYVAGGLNRRCDGETIVQEYTGHKTDYDYTPKPCARAYGGCACKPSGYMFFMLGQFYRATGLLGTFKLPTISINNISHLSSVLNFSYAQNGTLHNTVFTLSRRQQKITKPVRDGRGQVDEWLISLSPNVYGMTDGLLEGNGNQAPALATQPEMTVNQMVDWLVSNGKVTHDEALFVLGVSAVEEYLGTPDEASALLKAFVADKFS